ncbi:MAG: hypothetical protein HC771_16425 [Synechococcales cyanobacterium CRU_2_2]|nr:hypothetical protein [Synechococcales cyanobacterium CRU_2_2]
MSQETTLLIAILTILALLLGGDTLWNVLASAQVQRPGLSLNVNKLLSLNDLISMSFAALALISAILALLLRLNRPGRTEPYLLTIGLLSLLFYGPGITLDFLPRLAWTGLLSRLRLLPLLVSYWSFLHYALNPKL